MPFRSSAPRTHTDSVRHEREAAIAIGGRLTRGSGRGTDKGDAKNDRLLLECKVTRRGSYSISIETMDRITSIAAETGRFGILHLRFVDEKTGRKLREFAVIEADLLQDLA